MTMHGTQRRGREQEESKVVVVRTGRPRPGPPRAMPPRGATARSGDEHTFVCGESLLRAFADHAAELGCSVDWLFAESLRRMLDEPRPPPVVEPAPRRSPEVESLNLRVHTTDGTICAAASHGMVIGRSHDEANLVLAHAGVSRKHARLERRPAGWVVVDLASFNGVYVNGVRARCAPIAPGDVLTVGPFALVVERR